mmetsp:Transcript_13165/g.16033  ORF Transcript_13165/g.16033 Transcript_13165/m.16033 type:complete len:365 (-) Transcript_13165:275-1369(-)
MKLLLCCLSLMLLIDIASAFKSSTLRLDQDFSANSKAGRDLIASSTSVNGSRNLEDGDFSDFIGQYSIKFLDCHSVTEWNAEREQDDGSQHIQTNRLVRFRLCPTSSCQGSSTNGCTSRYGDYLIDIDTFVYNYLSAQMNLNYEISNYCDTECEDDDNGNCAYSCFANNGGSDRQTFDDDGVEFDPYDYSTCSAYNDYYVGPYCSSDGASINLGVFTDDECTSFSSCDTSCFYSTFGFYLPYASSSLVPQDCISCAYNSFSQYGNNDNNYEASGTCKNLYENSGKCESKMYITYPNESACHYIEGIKYITQDGVITHNAVKRSKHASIGIGMLSFSSILLVLYVQYLTTKLNRARFNLKAPNAM